MGELAGDFISKFADIDKHYAKSIIELITDDYIEKCIIDRPLILPNNVDESSFIFGVKVGMLKVREELLESIK